MTRPVWFVALIAAITFWSALLVSARAEESDCGGLGRCDERCDGDLAGRNKGQ